MKDTFAGYHPIVNFSFFVSVLAFSMIFTHPVCLAVSLVCSLTYSGYLNREKALRFNLRFMLPMLIVTALINPAFNHEDATILLYLRSGNPLTLESLVFGITAAVILITMISWFSCFNKVFTGDKFIYLFGRVIPALSLILSMTLRLVPHFKAQMKVISSAQKYIGRNVSNGNIFRKARHGLRILSILITWALENAIETADSMKSRGYGLPGRTAFSIYNFRRRDLTALAFIIACTGYIITGASLGGLYFRYFPTIKGNGDGSYSVSLYSVYLALCLSPVVINLWEDKKWIAIESKI